MARWTALIALLASCDPAEPAAPVTWTQAGAVLQDHCVDCHAEDGVGVPLDSHAAAAPLASAVAEVVARGVMPPWGAVATEACAPALPFAGDLRLSAEEAEVLFAWAEQGAPDGAPPVDAAPLEDPGAEPTEMWRVDEPYEAVGPDAVVCHQVGAPLAEGRWLTGARFEPPDPARTHHAVLMTVAPGAPRPRGWQTCYGAVGELRPLVFWAPGSAPFETPADAAIWVPAGTVFVLQTHFVVADAPQTLLAPEVGITWADEAPLWRAGLAILGNARDADAGLQPGPGDRDGPELRIPAGAVDHTETMRLAVPGAPGRKLWAIGHHMHLLGRSMTTRFVGAHDDACLLSTPAWDPDWQRLYRVDARRERLPPLREGDWLELTCTYDNDVRHAGARELLALTGETEPFDVVVGGTSRDEMCAVLVGWMEPND